MAQTPTPATEHGAEPDPSMDDILASIRRILNEDEKVAKPPADGVLVLDPSMIVEEGAHPAEPAAIDTQASISPFGMDPEGEMGLHPGAEEPRALAMTDDPMYTGSGFPDMPFPPLVSRDAVAGEAPLVAPAAAAAAAHSVGSLVRTLAAERSAAVTRGGLTIEDLVREEVRPVLKEWLDTHLPPLVERMVRAELERVVGRSTGL
ncbi:MAG: DUF2497 domain-containing protein [Pseudomonadota bacterium]|nr:DUF2497 domain-containing protein [Pseudomonadota bacterium]